jgi:hypothetical protein
MATFPKIVRFGPFNMCISNIVQRNPKYLKHPSSLYWNIDPSLKTPLSFTHRTALNAARPQAMSHAMGPRAHNCMSLDPSPSARLTRRVFSNDEHLARQCCNNEISFGNNCTMSDVDATYFRNAVRE